MSLLNRQENSSRKRTSISKNNRQFLPRGSRIKSACFPAYFHRHAYFGSISSARTRCRVYLGGRCAELFFIFLSCCPRGAENFPGAMKRQ
ncbi:hypothetical protein C6Q22_23170 [Burkholderia multivorans]|nr:hypothetical protein C6P92_16670 [Burkholderia multivorans]PRF81665.1 hypothetical protein C6Q22_23170 [Burkholderia multivorans]PRG42559.1 hypothetical protein C6T62_11185 [Burkholderia multivorans]PRG71963.1 hypothetical protein C6T69_14015 [Burkholderia multivorans]PRG95475.1 hypothetical protein C6V04_07745 [Burkholderia multivorans]